MEFGFMQGRRGGRVEGMIQAFPWQDWVSEFPTAHRLGIGLMEWTLDQDRLYENPLLTEGGRERIRQQAGQHGVRVLSLRSEEHTSELQSLMRISYAVFCLKKKKKYITEHHTTVSTIVVNVIYEGEI